MHMMLLARWLRLPFSRLCFISSSENLTISFASGGAGWYADERNARLRTGKGQQFNKGWVRTHSIKGGVHVAGWLPFTKGGKVHAPALEGYRLSKLSFLWKLVFSINKENIGERLANQNPFNAPTE